MEDGKYIRQAIAGVASVVAGDLLLDVSGLNGVIAEVTPVIAALLPHIGIGIGIGVLSYVIHSSYSYLKSKSEKKRLSVISDMDQMIRLINQFETKKWKQRNIRSINLIIEKYRDWFPPDLKDTDIEGTAFNIKETLSLYNYCEGYKRINDYTRRRRRVEEQKQKMDKEEH